MFVLKQGKLKGLWSINHAGISMIDSWNAFVEFLTIKPIEKCKSIWEMLWTMMMWIAVKFKKSWSFGDSQLLNCFNEVTSLNLSFHENKRKFNTSQQKLSTSLTASISFFLQNHLLRTSVHQSFSHRKKAENYNKLWLYSIS